MPRRKKQDNSIVCNQCGKNFSNGYSLKCFREHTEKSIISNNFCSTLCLSRWIGEKGWLYELYIRGKHDKEHLTNDYNEIMKPYEHTHAQRYLFQQSDYEKNPTQT